MILQPDAAMMMMPVALHYAVCIAFHFLIVLDPMSLAWLLVGGPVAPAFGNMVLWVRCLPSHPGCTWQALPKCEGNDLQDVSYMLSSGLAP
jgi:hypothetical protein